MKLVILGRENVGKSTLFNTLIHRNKAFISKEPGTTRDNKYGTALWRGKEMTIVDTAGINVDKESVINEQMQQKIHQALDEADVVLLIVNTKTGAHVLDRKLGKMIREAKKPYILVANKADNRLLEERSLEFKHLGLGDPMPISASSGKGTGDVLDRALEIAPEKTSKTKHIDKDRLRICLIGQPNVGKSSLLNAILGEDRVIVTDVPNTTREPNDIPFAYKKEKLMLIDTAGIRRKRQKRTLDALSMKKSLETIKSADIALLVIDASKNLSSQDLRLAGNIQDEHKGMIVVVNKWDLVEDKDTHSAQEFRDYLEGNMPFLKGIPLIFVSAKENIRIFKILDGILAINAEMNKEIPPKQLEKFMKYIVKKKKPVQEKGPKRPRILSIDQVGTAPPTFNVVLRKTDSLHFSYKRYIENQLREKYDFMGSPIKLNIVKASA